MQHLTNFNLRDIRGTKQEPTRTVAHHTAGITALIMKQQL